MLKTYHCDGFRPVTTDSASDAARVFAERMARSKYGARGAVGALRCDSWSQDGRLHVFEAFVGRKSRLNDVDGCNYWLSVRTL